MNDQSLAPLLRNVQTIRITSDAEDKTNSFIQIGGIVAIDAASGLNVALASLGAVARASSCYEPGYPSNAVNGQYPAAFPDIFHAALPGKAEYFELVLAKPSTLASLTIFGRSDGGSHRDVYKIALYGGDGTLLFRGKADGSQAAGGAVLADFLGDDSPHVKLPLWREDRPYRFAGLSRPRSVLKILLKTKNETLLLEKWIAHHAAIVGYENIIILDNMSDNEDVLNTYDKYNGIIDIVQFDCVYDDMHDTAKTHTLLNSIKSMSDYYLFIDTDEFLYFFNDGKFVSNRMIVDRLSAVQPKRSVPTTWLYTAPGYERRPMCSGLPAFMEGLKWGKTIFASTGVRRGVACHNCQMIVEDFLTPSPVPGFFLFHLTLLSPEQRIRANITKLVALGYADELDTVDAVLARDRKATKLDVGMYLDEIQYFLDTPEHRTSEADPLAPTVMRLESDGTAVFDSEAERAFFLRLINDFTSICKTTFSAFENSSPEVVASSPKDAEPADQRGGFVQKLKGLVKRSS